MVKIIIALLGIIAFTTLLFIICAMKLSGEISRNELEKK